MSKITFIMGAGSTSFLGIPQTNKHKEIFDELEKGNDFEKQIYRIIKDLFGDNYNINDIYNIIDSNIALDIGLNDIDNNKLREAKQIIIKKIIEKFNNKIKNRDNDNYNKLINFYYELAKHQFKIRFNNYKAKDIEKPNFYVSDYSIINFNWDLYSTMPILEANKKINDENNYYLPIKSNPKLKLFTDFNCEYVSNENNEDYGYSVTESVARSVNKEAYDAKRRIVLTKVYYPHGVENLYKCKSCAKHSMYFAKYNMNSVIDNITSKNEELYKCPYCKKSINRYYYDILIQSNFKVRNSYLEEVRINMMTELRNSDKLIFIGYSLPNDDVDYITLFKSLNNIKEVYVVLYKNGMEDKFIEASSVDTSSFNDEDKKAFNNYLNVFKGKKLYFNYAGFPNAIDEILRVYKQ